MKQNVQSLISGYLDDELTAEQAELLARLLETNAAALDGFLFQAFIHSQLLDWTNQERVQDRVISAAVAAHVASPCPTAWRVTAAADPASDSTPRKQPIRLTGGRVAASRFRSFAAWAAVLLIAVSISAITYTVTSRPLVVGQLTESTNCRWDTRHGEPADLPVGTLLQSGQELRLAEGRALVTFASGAQVLLEGPTSLRLDSPMTVHLHGGRVAARVPRHAIGFAVTSSLARFVDLGTEFTLTLDAEKTFELHVFEGLVEVWLDKRFGEAARMPVRVPDVRAVSFHVENGDIDTLHFQEGTQMPF